MKRKKQNKYNKEILITILCIIISIICGLITNDLLIGGIILLSGLLNSYYASIGKIYNYVFGAIYCLLSGYVSFINGLYGIAILSLLIYVPSQIQGYISWKKNINKDEVEIRGFTLRNSIIITLSCIIGSLILGYLLSMIPNQQLAFLDSSSNIINLCGIILMNLRFKECWAVWLFNNTIDLLIWIINAIKGTQNSYMMLLVSIGYLLINIYGLIKWIKMERKSKVNNNV